MNVPKIQEWYRDYRDALLALAPGYDFSKLGLEHRLDWAATHVANLLRSKRQEMGID